MRISDWSSDVCSSDLHTVVTHSICVLTPDTGPLLLRSLSINLPLSSTDTVLHVRQPQPHPFQQNAIVSLTKSSYDAGCAFCSSNISSAWCTAKSSQV